MNPKDLIKILESKLEQSPSNEDVKGQLASLLLSQGNFKRAESLYQEIINSNPTSHTALWGLARIHWHKKSYDTASGYMNKLTSVLGNKLSKDQALIYAKILAQKTCFAEASRWLDLAIAQDSSLLQSEMSLLKFIKNNLSMQNSEASGENKNTTKEISNSAGIAIPIGAPGRKSQYIVIEISHFDAQNFQSENNTPPEEPISEEGEKEDLSQIKKIITFDQVGGMRAIKQSLIQDLILPLKNPQICSVYGKSTNPKILLYGPPACGKTLVARALSAEAEINFFPIRAYDFAGLNLEEAEMKLAYILQLARENKPSVILLDEILWLAHSKESDYGEDESYFYRASLLNSLLDGISGNYPLNGQIGLLATTAFPWLLESSFLLSSRINKHIFVNGPSNEEKAEILFTLLKEKASQVVDPSRIDCTKVIKALKHLSNGADLENLIDEALSDLLIETVVNMQNGSKDKKLILSTDRLIRIGKTLKCIPAVDLWMSEAKTHLNTKHSPLKHLWTQIEEVQQGFGGGLQTKSRVVGSK